MPDYSILLVDDEEIVLKSYRKDLSSYGYHIETASNGADAIARLEHNSFNIIITDLVMPGLGGLDVLKAVRDLSSEAGVIILTGHGDMVTAVKALQKGADDYLCKPCDIEELNFRIERCLEKQDYKNKMRLAEVALRKSHENLELKVKERTRNLEEANIALTVLLKKRDKDKKRLEEQVLANTKELIIPYLEKLNKTHLTRDQRSCLEIVDKNLKELTSPFIRSLSSKFLKLTPAELQVANLIRHGMTTKEIATTLNLSVETINNHRKHIRKKSGITNKKINLQTILSSFSDPK